MKWLAYIVLGLLALIPATGCSKNNRDTDRRTQRDLFYQSISLLEKNTNTIINTTDSAKLDSVYNLYEEELTALNLKFPPETDFKMTESENDTLITLITRINHLRDSLLKSFATKPIAQPDTTYF